MSRDLREYSKQTHTRLIVGGILILLFIGDGLIYVFYGRGAAVLGLACLMAGLFPLLLIWFALLGIEWIARYTDRN